MISVGLAPTRHQVLICFCGVFGAQCSHWFLLCLFHVCAAWPTSFVDMMYVPFLLVVLQYLIIHVLVWLWGCFQFDHSVRVLTIDVQVYSIRVHQQDNIKYSRSEKSWFGVHKNKLRVSLPLDKASAII